MARLHPASYVYGSNNLDSESCGLCEALFFARKNGSSPSSLVKMEEKIARCMNVRWHDCDMPGELS